MRLCLLSLFIPFFAHADFNDSYAKSLSCSGLSKKSVLKSVQSTAFSVTKQFPVQNWSSGVLGQCWSMALSQRRFFYLARYEVRGAAKQQDELVTYGLNLIRSTDPNSAERGPDREGESRNSSEQYTPLAVFGLEEKGLSAPDRWGYSSASNYMRALQSGTQGRNFRTEIEYRQKLRFFSPGNLGMVFGSRERSESANEESMEEILKDHEAGRITLLIVRAATSLQHAILVLRVEKVAEGNYRLLVYDSNQPGREPSIEYRDRQFYAPSVVGLFHHDARSPVGIFVKDDDEMDEIQDALYAHYRGLCKESR